MKSLPHSLEAERAVLGSVLLHPPSMAEVTLSAEDFHHPAHGAIFAAMQALDARSLPIDWLAVYAEMQAQQTDHRLVAQGGEGYLAGLTSDVVSVENVGHHAREVRSRATVRRLVQAAQEIAAEGMGEYGDADDYAQRAEARILALTTTAAPDRSVKLEQAVGPVIKAIESRYNDRRAVTGVPTGYEVLDSATTGLHPGRLYVVAARPAMGKTSWVCSALASAAVAGVPCLFFSLEMSRDEVVERWAAAQGGVATSALRTGYLGPNQWQRLTDGLSRLHGWPVWVDDSTALPIARLRATARRWRARHAPSGSALIAVDYLQLLRGERVKGRQFNREQEIADISGALKALSKDLRCPVIALAQLNRDLEKRQDKRPMMSDLRESGAIEQDADLVAFLFRPVVYDEAANPEEAHLIVGKHRHGELVSVAMRWEGQCTRFTDAGASPKVDRPKRQRGAANGSTHWQEVNP